MKTWTWLVLLAAASAVSASAPSKKTFLQRDLAIGDSQPAQKVVVKWPEVSAVPKVLQVFFAFSWVAMLALLPFIIPLSDKEPVTKTQIAVGTCMMFVLFGGFYLFTNVILFQSVHFDKVRPLTIVECIYFMSQVITTVGYGDITPAKQSGQMFVALYVLGALFIIANIVSDVACHIMEKLEERKRLRHEAALAEYAAAQSARDSEKPETPRVPVRALIQADKPSLQPLALAFTNFLILAACWVAFFVLYPGEGKTVFQAIYMALITLSTVGLGAITPVTEGGMIFGAYWMLFGVCCLGNVVSAFTDYAVASHKFDLYRAHEDEAVETLRATVHGKPDVTALQFLKFCLLAKGSVKKTQIELIIEAFQAMGPMNGVLDIKAVEDQLVSNPVGGEEELAFSKAKSKDKLRQYIRHHEEVSPRH